MTALYARIPERLVERLREEAADQRRSPSAQLEVLLEERYADAPAAPQAA